MGNLTSCRTCGKEIARSAATCPHCGARNKMQIGCCSGCLLMFISLFALLWFIGTELASTDKERPPEIKEESTIVHTSSVSQKQNASVSYDEDSLVVLSEEYAENRLNVKTRLKWRGKWKVEKLRESGNHAGGLYAVDRDFTELNAFNVEIKHHAQIFMEFHPEKGYRGVGLIVDGKTI